MSWLCQVQLLFCCEESTIVLRYKTLSLLSKLSFRSLTKLEPRLIIIYCYYSNKHCQWLNMLLILNLYAWLVRSSWLLELFAYAVTLEGHMQNLWVIYGFLLPFSLTLLYYYSYSSSSSYYYYCYYYHYYHYYYCCWLCRYVLVTC